MKQKNLNHKKPKHCKSNIVKYQFFAQCLARQSLEKFPTAVLLNLQKAQRLKYESR